MKKSEYIHEVKPKAAIEASGIQTLRHGRVVVVDHHVALAFETFHYKFFPVLFSRKRVRTINIIDPNEAGSK